MAPVLDLIAWSLLGVWALLLCGGLLWGRSPSQDRLIPAWTLAASAATLLLLAWFGYLLTRAGTARAGYAFGIAAGLTACTVGDLFIARRPAPKWSPVGISFFACGHLLYSGAIARYLVRYIAQYGDGLGGMRWLALTLWLAFGALAGWAVLLRARRRGPLWASAAVAYTLLLCSTAGLASGLALTVPLFGVLAAGALLLLLSDLVLVAALSVNLRLPWIGNAARLLRVPAQALIVVSIWSALQDFT